MSASPMERHGGCIRGNRVADVRKPANMHNKYRLCIIGHALSTFKGFSELRAQQIHIIATGEGVSITPFIAFKDLTGSRHCETQSF